MELEIRDIVIKLKLNLIENLSINLTMLIFYFKFKENNCPLCQEGRECGFRIPRLQDFERGGLFENVKLPLYENKELPINLKKYIFPNNWDDKYNYAPFHSVYHIKRYLNTLYYEK
jgi:hypothetical protein